MTKKRLICAFASLAWFGIVGAIWMDGCHELAVREATLEANRDYNRQHPGEDAMLEWICGPVGKVNSLLILPLAIAGALTAFGRWKIGLMFGIPAIVLATYQFWVWHAENAEMLRLMNQ